MSPPDLPAFALLGVPLLAYISLVRLLRWRLYNSVHAKFAERSLDSITPQEAQEIIQLSDQWDLPFITLYALSFAMFKTYAIPSISLMLANTKELSHKDLVSKRQADTGILISTFMACPIDGRYTPQSFYYDPSTEGKDKDDPNYIDPRAMIALSRMNWLHSRYKIKNEDYLFTLALFVFEPPDWADKYGWRSLSMLERHALFVYWSEIGRRMGIRDIPETIEELRFWSLEYAEEAMIPAQSNYDVAGYTTEELLRSVPTLFGLKLLARRIIVCFLDERVRLAMIQNPQPRVLHLGVKILMWTIKFTQGWLLLPRRKPRSACPFAEREPYLPGPGGQKPRMHPNKFQAKPWYKPVPTSSVGKFIQSVLLLVGYYEDIPGKEFKCEGYRLEEIGPSPVENVGHEEVFRCAEDLLGCPIVGPWALDGGLSDQ